MESVVDWLPRVGAVLMLIIGLVGFFKPQLFTASMGIEMTKPEAWSEIRAVFGGMNIGLSIAALLLNSPQVYMSLGLAWLFLTLARFYSIAKDGMTFRSSIPPIVIDGGIAALFLSGFFA
ncbi:MAG: DUF4345 family protein [Gammaproteobacteria bacterium]|nr:DUF4345 family protein [Gammaproteobacteria bacterium]